MANKIKYWRNQRDMDVATLSKKSKVPRSTIYKYEADARMHPPETVLICLADALGVTSKQLISGCTGRAKAEDTTTCSAKQRLNAIEQTLLDAMLDAPTDTPQPIREMFKKMHKDLRG